MLYLLVHDLRLFRFIEFSHSLLSDRVLLNLRHRGLDHQLA